MRSDVWVLMRGLGLGYNVVESNVGWCDGGRGQRCMGETRFGKLNVWIAQGRVAACAQIG